MAIQFQYEVEGELLSVTASGRDENFQQVREYQIKLLEIVLENGCKFVFCDERKLVYNLPVTDYYQMVAEAPPPVWDLKKVAIVCSTACLRDGKAMETFAVNQGIQMLVTDNYHQAQQWLKG